MKFSALSIKQKLILILLFAVLASTALISTVSQFIARDLLAQNVEQGQLPSLVKQLGNRVDKEVTMMTTMAHAVATNPDILAWSAAGASKTKEPQMVAYMGELARFNDLAVVSFVDRKTYNYWNQDGFLRTLKNDQLDGWFFAYKDSGENTSLSLYNEPGVGYRLFANYQQLNGRGMSGVAKSVDGLVSILNATRIARTGDVFMVDSQGRVIAHKDASLLGQISLNELTDARISRTLLAQNEFNLARLETESGTRLYASTYVASAGWYVIAQVPEAELFLALNEATTQTVLWAVGIAAIFAFLGVILAGTITRPVEQLADTFQALGKGNGDLTTRLAIPAQQEMRRLVSGFNNFISALHATMTSVSDTSQRLRNSAANVAGKSQETEHASQIQRDRTIQVAAALTEMGSSVAEIARSAQSAADSANTSAKTTQQGRELTTEAVNAISTLSTQVSSVANTIEALDEHTSAIGGILETIRSISEQTNLLALNAAIEAARAGDHGRGFSVVADEVRTLAQRAASATDEIQQKIDSFRTDSQQAVSQMQASRVQTESVVEATTNIDTLLVQIAADIERINDMNAQVATATEQQSSVVHEISQNINEISDTSEDNLNTASRLVDVSSELDQLASELGQQVGRFRL